MPRPPECADCIAEGVERYRPPAIGKDGKAVARLRCTTHHRAHRKAARTKAKDVRLARTYELPEGVGYAALYASQGGRCYVCRRATGKVKRLAVDHNHRTGEVRGLLCGPCNKGVIGHLREDPEALRRAIVYLLSPPARPVLRGTPQVFD
jgi:predicted ATPase